MYQSCLFRQQGTFATTRLCLVLIAIFAWMCPPVAAQINTGKITGIITDSGGAVVSGASLRATNQGTGVVTTATSQDGGNYLVNFLIPGHYTIEVQSTGFQRSIEKDVEVTAGGTARLDFAMQVGEVHQTVEVQAHPNTVNTESAELTQTFGYKALDQL